MRPYKPAWSVADATAEMQRQSGRHFDTQVLDAFLSGKPEASRFSAALGAWVLDLLGAGAEPGTAQARRAAKLGGEVDVWVASADAEGDAYLIPLSYYWDGVTLTLSTPRASRTATNLIRAGRARWRSARRATSC